LEKNFIETDLDLSYSFASITCLPWIVTYRRVPVRCTTLSVQAISGKSGWEGGVGHPSRPEQQSLMMSVESLFDGLKIGCKAKLLFWPNIPLVSKYSCVNWSALRRRKREIERERGALNSRGRKTENDMDCIQRTRLSVCLSFEGFLFFKQKVF
jgi:hypothetical protein